MRCTVHASCESFYNEYLETCKQKAFLLCATARESSADRSDKTTCDNQGNRIGRAFLLKQEHTVHGILCHKCQIMPFCKYLNICLQHTYLVFNIFGLQHEGNLANTHKQVQKITIILYTKPQSPSFFLTRKFALVFDPPLVDKCVTLCVLYALYMLLICFTPI